MLSLYLHRVYGELKYPQVDANWESIQSQVNALTTAVFPVDNLTATADPTVNDDDTEGYSALSRWYNTISGEMFVLTDAATGAAVWVESGLVLESLGTASLVNVGAGSNDVPQNSILGEAAYIDVSDGSDVAAGADSYSALTPAAMQAAQGYETIVYAASLVIDGAEFLNGVVTLTGDVEFGEPDNFTAGERRLIVKGDSATDRTVTFDGDYFTGELPTISDVTNTRHYLITLIAIPGGWTATAHRCA